MKLFKLKKDLSNLEEVAKQVSKLLKAGAVGVIPTETIYGIAADPFNKESVEKIFKIKKRERSKPILLLIPDEFWLKKLAKVSHSYVYKLISAFWAGPLTMVFQASEDLPDYIKGDKGTIGLRMSSSIFVKTLLKHFKSPITGTSANPSGSQPAKNPEEIKKHLSDLDFIVDAGEVKDTTPSTVIEVLEAPPKLLREGVIPFKEVLKVYSSSPSSSLNSISK